MRVASCLVGSVSIGLVLSVAGCGNSSPSGSDSANTQGGNSNQSNGQSNAQGGGSAQSNVGGNSANVGGTSNSGSTAASVGGGNNPAGGSSSVTPNAGGNGSNVGGSGTNNTTNPLAGGSSAQGGNSNAGGNSAKTGGASGVTTSGGAPPAGGSSAKGGTSQTGGASSSPGGTSNGTAPPTLPVTPKAWKPSSTCVTMAQTKRGSMTAAQKAAQMVMPEAIAATNAQITSTHYGAIFAGGAADPSAGNSATAWRDWVNGQHTAAGSDWPLLWGIDAVHGHNNVQNATMFPHNIGLGCTRDPELLKQVGRVTALEMRGTGINWTFAPTISAALDERWGRTFESFSEDPAIDAWLGQALVEGLQQGDLKNKQSVIACAKHFAGDGATQNGVDKADVTLDAATFQKLCVDQYQPLINYGVATVMISYSKYQGTSLSADTELVTNKLRQEMGFAGLVTSDYNAILKLPGGGTPDAYGNAPPTDQQVAAAINAGIDMLMMAQSSNVSATVSSLTSLAGGAIAQSRIDDAVDRILTLKCEMGMFDSGYSAAADSALTSQVGSADHRAVARKAVQESMVVLKNDSSVLPLSKTANILVAGTAADSIPKQCGGWTVDWQGLAVPKMSTATTTQGTSILAGMKTLNTKITYDQNGSGTGDIGVVIVGESPYAEEYGDATDLTLKGRSATDDTVLTTMLGKGIPIVLVVISGRPLILDAYISNPNLKGIVAAWLPGSEGQGVADVLFGDFKPIGKLGHSWPKTMSQVPINQSDADYASDPPLFPVGHGLTW